MNESETEKRSGAENGGPSLTGDSSFKQVHDTSCDTSDNIDLSITNTSDNEQGTGTELDKDSLFNTLKSQTAEGMLPFKSMLKDLLDGFNHTTGN